ncbi:non-heme iron oxygenase ferredoxin subunit [Saccharothrix coeruleofusca]|uniref:(2Fe-2S)-binding protein n=1 Tax=Saccharothrix coeruleofusca TaxID=33919 RepID=A0A918ANM1_9PSEU|nr:non-heme iron oxygenase ferredoxin subunit [Saccharothrix coeruleofusca]MBP2337746.1 3-phenylpropionate/trans-cinnamate dioxygenase ferredoxin subunit [Saccharothrix coeruleofusca]GGP61971.1 (2Fe-2S)-binding protein [Saccharothrix coeruleofusca]
MIRVCSLTDLDDRKPAAFEVGDEHTPVLLVRDGDRVHALRDLCSHAEVSLSEGEVTRRGVECWLHGSCFDLSTGRPSSPPATEPVDVFAVELRGGDVYVDVTTTTN